MICWLAAPPRRLSPCSTPAGARGPHCHFFLNPFSFKWRIPYYATGEKMAVQNGGTAPSHKRRSNRMAAPSRGAAVNSKQQRRAGDAPPQRLPRPDTPPKKGPLSALRALANAEGRWPAAHWCSPRGSVKQLSWRWGRGMRTLRAPNRPRGARTAGAAAAAVAGRGTAGGFAGLPSPSPSPCTPPAAS
jgi:hypothetical protein